MKNADRINFYLSGLRQPGSNPAERHVAVATGTSAIPDSLIRDASRRSAGSETIPAPTAPGATAPVPTIPGANGTKTSGAEGMTAATAPGGGSPSFREALLATEAGQELLALDQVQLHRLLRQLEHSRRLAGERSDETPALARKKQRQLIGGLIVAGLIIAVQATAVVWLYQRAELLLGRPLSPALLFASSAGDVTVTFRPSASSGDVGVLLRELNLQIVEGPDAGGRYVLRPETDSDRAHALNALRDRRDLVYSAEDTY